MPGFILGPMLEEHLRIAMLLRCGSAVRFVTRPFSGMLFALIALFVAWQLVFFFSKVGAAKGPRQVTADGSAYRVVEE